MRIQTTYEVKVEVDEETFSVVVSDLSASDKKIINELSFEIKKVQEQMNILTQKVDEIAINEEILKIIPLVDKVKLLFEQKTLKKEISELRKNIEHEDIEKKISELFMKRLELTLGGEDKEKFLNIVKRKNIDPQKVLTVIAKKIEENTKKKLNDLSSLHMSTQQGSLS